MKYFAYTIIGIVALTIIAGFFIVGSPAQERLRRTDDQRVQYLQIIQSEIINYWMSKARLPEKLADLEDNIRGFVAPNDPVTSAAYEYVVRGPEMFTLCATFDLPNTATSETLTPKPLSMSYPASGESNWQHQAGYTCFERTIDTDFYRPKKIEP